MYVTKLIFKGTWRNWENILKYFRSINLYKKFCECGFCDRIQQFFAPKPNKI